MSIGDSLELARRARDFEGDVIAFCGVVFMAETAKVLNPTRTVVLPDLDAGCSLVDSCTAEQVRAFRERHPDHVIVSYVNTSVEVKAESDILCTSRNAVRIVNSIPADKPILFLPDINLGNYVKQQTGRENMTIWQGACIVHATFLRAPAGYCAGRASAGAGGGASGVPRGRSRDGGFHRFHQRDHRLVRVGTADEYIVMTESGVRHSLERLAPQKRFYFVPNENCNCSECPYMRRNTLEKLRDCLTNLTPRIELSDDIIRRAALPIERMLAVR